MWIQAGKYRNRKIAAPEGEQTRPVLSRIRKAIFDTAGGAVEGAQVLDLFAGSGGFVIEALSRGAAGAVAIDLAGNAVRAIRANLKAVRVEEPVEVYKNDAFDAIEKLRARGKRFELIVVAPPYWKGLQARALHALDAADILAPEGYLFVQRDAHEKMELDPARPLERLERIEERVYGNTIIEWFRNRGAAPAPASPEGEGDAGSSEGETGSAEGRGSRGDIDPPDGEEPPPLVP